MNREKKPDGRKFVRASKFLSLILRHKPEKIGLTLDSQGWADIEVLLKLTKRHLPDLDRAILNQIVSENDKQRFAISDDGTRIRANQGHSIERIQLNLESRRPPEFLFHGTVSKFIESIQRKGLVPGSRNHVHLSVDRETAEIVGKRRGQPVILTVNSQAMFDAEHQFYLSANGVWLTQNVPSEYIQFPS